MPVQDWRKGIVTRLGRPGVIADDYKEKSKNPVGWSDSGLTLALENESYL
jgi:hypothetical protein